MLFCHTIGHETVAKPNWKWTFFGISSLEQLKNRQLYCFFKMHLNTITKLLKYLSVNSASLYDSFLKNFCPSAEYRYLFFLNLCPVFWKTQSADGLKHKEGFKREFVNAQDWFTDGSVRMAEMLRRLPRDERAIFVPFQLPWRAAVVPVLISWQ